METGDGVKPPTVLRRVSIGIAIFNSLLWLSVLASVFGSGMVGIGQILLVLILSPTMSIVNIPISVKLFRYPDVSAQRIGKICLYLSILLLLVSLAIILWLAQAPLFD